MTIIDRLRQVGDIQVNGHLVSTELEQESVDASNRVSRAYTLVGLKTYYRVLNDKGNEQTIDGYLAQNRYIPPNDSTRLLNELEKKPKG